MLSLWQTSEQEQATQSALWRGIGLVLLPGLAFVVGLIAMAMPARPPISTVYGCYGLSASPLLRVGPKLIAVDGSGISPIQMSIEKGKEGYVINASSGFSFQTDENGKLRPVKDYPQGELMPVFISQSRPPSIGLISNGSQIKIPKIGCPR